MRVVLIAAALALRLLAQPTPQQNNAETRIRQALQTKTGIATLPNAEIEISREIILPPDIHDLEIRGSGATIKASGSFRGRALIVVPAGRNIRIHDLNLDGNRDSFSQPVAPPQASAMLSRVIGNNGILAEGVAGLEIAKIKVTGTSGFAVLINGGSNVRVQDVEVTKSGSLDATGHNNGSGGIALEEGVAGFEILHALMGDVRGNGIWIRSTGASATKGRIADSEFGVVGRAAIAVDHASALTIENNRGHMIGFPGEEAIVTTSIMPSAVTVNGAVDHASIRGNKFDQIAGRCFSLEGFSGSEIKNNECTDLLFNAILMRGSDNAISGNHIEDVNTSRRDQPPSISTGIYFADGSSGNTVSGNDVIGYGMSAHCVGGPGMAANKITINACSDGPSYGWLMREPRPGILR